MKKILTLFLFTFIFFTNSNISFSIEPDVFIQSTVNRAADTLGGNFTKDERIVDSGDYPSIFSTMKISIPC